MTTEQYREEGFRLYDEDIEKAVECLKKAAEDKDVPSAVALAGYYYDEEDDYETAKEWLEKAFKWNKKSEKTKEFSSYIALGHTNKAMPTPTNILDYSCMKATSPMMATPT